MGVWPMSLTGVSPVCVVSHSSSLEQQSQQRQRHGQDARETHGQDAHATRRRTGFTLIETILSVAITAVIGLSLTGIMVMAQRALAGGLAEADQAYKADRAMQMILADINLATSMPARSATSITLVVPPRNGDTQSETIIYSWDGVAGDPLTRQYNGGTATTLVENVYQLNFNYLTKTLGP
jgi:type II secretory pathway pseudopilin PulG